MYVSVDGSLSGKKRLKGGGCAANVVVGAVCAEEPFDGQMQGNGRGNGQLASSGRSSVDSRRADDGECARDRWEGEAARDMAWEEEEKKQESVSNGSETPTSESREAAEQQTGRPCCAGTRYKDMQTGHLGRPGSLALSARPGRGICIGRHCHRRRASVRSKQATTNHRPPVSGEHNHPPALPPAGLLRHAGPKTPPASAEGWLHPDKSQQHIPPVASRRHPCSPATKANAVADRPVRVTASLALFASSPGARRLSLAGDPG